ncbi:MAG TPA: dockerin type I domain-containing protein, partial [Isosphaeraceae bacterium]|nr:dockerin type I domain-containing protein [Isosphaeraceae bacterium]
VAHAPAVVEARNLALHRHATILGVTAQPVSTSELRPNLLRSLSTAGRRLPFHNGAPFNARVHPFAMAYTKAANPGVIASALTGSRGTTGSAVVTTQLLGDANGDGQVDMTDLQEFPSAFNSRIGDPNYNLALDFNHNGQIGQDDGRLILRNMTPLAPKQPLKLEVHILVPQQAHTGHVPVSAKGGVANTPDVTIVGHTVPGALVFTDSTFEDYSFNGPVYVTDARGNFSYQLHLDQPFTNADYLVLDAYGQQLVKDLPLRLATMNTS